MQCGQKLSDYSKNISFTETRVILQPNVQSFESQFDKKEVLSVFFVKSMNYFQVGHELSV